MFLFCSLRRTAGVLLLGLLAAVAAPAQSTTPSSYPAAQDFDQAGSDPQAIAIADRVMNAMGGYQNWQNTRYLAWGFFGGQYQIWDKYTGDFHWEKDSLVANYNLNTKQGHAYSKGQDISDTEAGKKLLNRMYPVWINNSWWLVMPFKLKDSGVTLSYKGTGTTQTGDPAEIIGMTFKNVGVTPNNRYELLVNPKTNLVEEWAYFPKATDEQPAFRRRWMNYQQKGLIKLASDRSESAKPAALDYVAATQKVPKGTMQSKTPVAKL